MTSSDPVDDGESAGTTDAAGGPGIVTTTDGRRGLLARLGGAAGIASLAGCFGGGGDDGGEEPNETEDFDDLDFDAVELRAILKEFDGGYEQSVLDRADRVRRQQRDSVVFLDLRPERVPYRLATGWFVGEGTVLTVKRKLGSLSTVPVHTVDGVAHEAEVLESHEIENLALLELDVAGEPIDPSLVSDPPDPNEPLVQIGHHDEYGHWVATVGDYLRTQTFDDPELVDEHWSNTPGLPGSGGAPVFDLDGNLVGMTNGAVPRDRLEESEELEPLNDYVYDWQMSHREWFNHLDAEQTLEEVESWL